MVRMLPVLWLAASLGVAYAQQSCAPTPLYSLCEIIIQIPDSEASRHSNPYLSAEYSVEFRSPKGKTYLSPGFWDGGRKMVARIAPDEVGEWNYRINASFGADGGKTGTFQATASDVPGFVRTANVHHFRYSGSGKAHLWMGDTLYPLATVDRAFFDQYVTARAGQKFNHVRGLALPAGDTLSPAFSIPDQPNVDYFRELDGRILALNKAGITVDLILGGDQNQLAKAFPTWQQRERYLRYMAGRYGAMNVTWQLVQEYEEYVNSRALMREMGLALKKHDPYDHPLTTHTTSSSSPLLGDKWMTHILYQSASYDLGVIEHLMNGAPQVNAELGYEDSGAGKSHPHHVDSDEFRRRLWTSTMAGQYVTHGNTGVYGGSSFPKPDAKYLDAPGAKAMTAWFDTMSRTRWWDLEPYFELENGKALALEGIEYIAYIDKPGPLELVVQKHDYVVWWINPATGEATREKKEWKGEVFNGTPPNAQHDWVLHLSRDGKKEGMLRSYYFESRRIILQEPELTPAKIPFEVSGIGISLIIGKPVLYSMKLTKESRGTRRMSYLLTGEVARDNMGSRILASGPEGRITIPTDIAQEYPAVMSLRAVGMNALGKLYITDLIVNLTRE